MLRKEFSEVLKQSLFFIVLSVTIPFGLEFAFGDPTISYYELFFTQYHFGLLIFALFLGNSLFLWDRKQRAGDYLLSLPYSRLRLLGIKVLPRLTAAVLFYLVFLLLYQSGGEAFTLASVFSFTYIYFSLFIVAVSLSLSMENYIMMAVVTLLAMAVVLGMIYLIPTLLSQILYGTDIGLSLEYLLVLRIGSGKLLFYLLGVTVGLLFPFIATFVFTFKKIGIHPVNRFNKRFFKIFVPLFAAGVILSSLLVYSMFKPEYKNYYLTEGHRLLEWDSLGIRVHDEDSVEEVEHSSFRRSNPVLIETGGSIYFREYYYTESYTAFVRLDLETLSVETFYKLPGRNYSAFTGPWVFKNTIAIVDGYSGDLDKTLHLIDINTKEVKKIKFPQTSSGNVRLFGAGEVDGNRFWLLDSEWRLRHRVYRLWENGEKEELGTSEKLACYINGLLMTYSKDTVTLTRLTAKGTDENREIKTITVGEGFVFYPYRLYDLHKPPLKETIGAIYDENNEGRKFYTLDTENLELREITVVNDKIEESTRRDPALKYDMSQPIPGAYYYFEYKRENHRLDIRKVYAFDNDELTLLKEFPPLDEGARTHISIGGIVIREPGRLTAYAPPDLRELTFKKLEE